MVLKFECKKCGKLFDCKRGIILQKDTYGVLYTDNMLSIVCEQCYNDLKEKEGEIKRNIAKNV